MSLDDLQPVKGTTSIGTAKTGASLKVLGETKQPLYIQIGGIATKLWCRPVVLDGLAMPFNISGPFLKEHGLDQLHSQDAIRFQGHTIKLVSNIASPKQESVSSKAYVQGNYTIKPFSVQYVKLSVPEVLAARMPHGDGYVTGDTDFMTTTDMHPWSALCLSIALRTEKS